MLLQFSTGSVSDPASHHIHIVAHNAGVQPANIAATLRKQSAVTAHQAVNVVKIVPQEERVILDEIVPEDGAYEVMVQIDSPTLILTLQAETHDPLGFFVELVNTWSPSSHNASNSQSVPLMWGYVTKGIPF